MDNAALNEEESREHSLASSLLPATVAAPDDADPVALGDDDYDDTPVGCCATLRAYTPAIKVAIFAFLHSCAGNIAAPPLIDAKRDFFGSGSDAALAQSVFDCTAAALNLVLASYYGRLLNAYGRRKFFLAAGALQFAAFASLAALPTVPVVFMAIHHVQKFVQHTYMWAYLTDVCSPKLRPKSFGVVSGIKQLAMFGGLLPATVKLSHQVYFIVAAAVAGLGLLMVLVIPESLPPERRTRVACSELKNPFTDIGVLFKSRVLIMCTVTLILLQLCDAGISDVYLYYLHSRVGFNEQDFGFLEVELGLLAPVVVVGLMPRLLNVISAPLILATAATGNAGAWIIVGTIWAKWPIFAIAIPMAAVVQMGPPLLYGLVASAGHKEGAARRLAAINAIGDFCNAFGPLFFGVTYSQFHGALQALPFFVGAAFCLCAAYVASRITTALKHDADTGIVSAEAPLPYTTAGHSSSEGTQSSSLLDTGRRLPPEQPSDANEDRAESAEADEGATHQPLKRTAEDT